MKILLRWLAYQIPHVFHPEARRMRWYREAIGGMWTLMRPRENGHAAWWHHLSDNPSDIDKHPYSVVERTELWP